MPTTKLTARFVETAKVATGRLDYRDTLARGFELRVTAAGSKSWAVRYTRRSDGRRRRLTLGAFPAMTLDDARTAAREQLAAVSRGADPAGKVQERKEALTFGELADEWLKRHAEPNKSIRAVKDDRSMLSRHVLPELGAMKASEITKRDVIRLLDNVAARPDARLTTDARLKAEKTAPRRLTHRPNRVFELVRSIFRWGIGRDLLKADPTAGLAAPIRKEKARTRDLSADEIRTLWRALDRAPVKRAFAGQGAFPMTRATALALKLALVTGQRIGEVAGMTDTELVLDGAAPIWTVPGERSKNGEPNRVPLSPLALELIAEARELAGDSPYLFPSPLGRGPIDAHAPTKALERARPTIGIPHFRVHDLRRTAATGMAELGVSPHTISLVLNHVSASKGTITGKVYVQYTYDREKRAALGAWGRQIALLTARGECTLVAAE